MNQLLKHSLSYAPIVGVLGHRQVGKTTVFGNKLIGIDECQEAPPLFPVLKDHVRKFKKPGQFLLSGSVRFTSKKLIKESLTGRISNLELLPFTVSELDSKPLPSWLRRCLDAEFWPPLNENIHKSTLVSREKMIKLYENRGGLPGVCLLKDERARLDRLRDQLETILDRDIKKIYFFHLTLAQIMSWIKTLAQNDGSSYNLSQMKRVTGISTVTQRKLLRAIEAVFLVRFHPIEGGKSGYSVWFEDHLEASYLKSGNVNPENEFTGLVYRNVREQFYYAPGMVYDFFQYRTRGGAVVPIAIRGSKGILGIIPVLDGVILSALSSARSFLSRYRNSKVLIVTRSATRLQDINSRIRVISAHQLLWEE